MASFDYSKAKQAAADAGLSWSDEVAEQVDREFVNLTLDQAQVDRLLVLYVHYLKWALGVAFDPKRLTFGQRIAAAFHFLKG